MPLTDDQNNEVRFISGFLPNGTLAPTAYWTWTHQTGTPTYSNMSQANKWGGTTAGTAGGTVTYSFAANITATQQSAFLAGLQLWQDETNISFMQAPAGTTPSFVFQTNNMGTANFGSGRTLHATGTTTVGPPTSFTNQNGMTEGPRISVDIASGNFGKFNNDFSDNGLSFQALVHEEGHMIGLGHAGPYDASTETDSPNHKYQFTAYDSKQYSIMSYNDVNNSNGGIDTSGSKYDPSIDTANYNKTYTTTTTNNDGSITTTTIGRNNFSTTPMELDILSAQRLYGAPTSGALTQAQTFGFNCTITDATATFFNFKNYVEAQASGPVVTIYDSATVGSTLDLSGYTTASTIDLNQGAFSSCDGMTNNLCIAFNTKVDTAIGGAGNDTITVNNDNDMIDGGGGMNTAKFTQARSNYVIGPSTNGVTTVTNSSTGAVDTLMNIQTLSFSDQQVSAPCYCTGTLIRTTRGDVAVEDLLVGDIVVTAAGSRRPIVWIGHRTVDCRRHPRPDEIMPVRIMADAFGPSRPTRDLRVSPGHAICIDVLGEILIPASSLLNGATITQENVERVTYWHVELDSHDVLLAENLPAESYLDMGNRDFFGESKVVMLDAGPDRLAPGKAGFCRPHHIEGALVEAARRRLMARAEQLDAQSIASLRVA